jgi:hypothetical protein
MHGNQTRTAARLVRDFETADSLYGGKHHDTPPDIAGYLQRLLWLASALLGLVRHVGCCRNAPLASQWRLVISLELSAFDRDFWGRDGGRQVRSSSGASAPTRTPAIPCPHCDKRSLPQPLPPP